MSATPEREQAEALMSELRFRCGGGNAEVIDALAAAVSRLVERERELTRALSLILTRIEDANREYERLDIGAIAREALPGGVSAAGRVLPEETRP